MKTREDAETVLSLFAERDDLKKTAEYVLTAPQLAVCDADWAQAGAYGRVVKLAPFALLHVGEDIRELVKREVALRVAEIEAQLRALGVES